MNITLKENDLVRSLVSVVANNPSEERDFVINTDAVGTVVMVYEDDAGIKAYEVEFFITAEDLYALATIDASKVARADSTTERINGVSLD